MARHVDLIFVMGYDTQVRKILTHRVKVLQGWRPLQGIDTINLKIKTK